MQNPWLFYILSPNNNTYIRHLHPITAQIFHFAYSHGEKQKRDFVSHCKDLHEQFLSWQSVLPTLLTDTKTSPWYLSTPIPLLDCLHIVNDDFILCIHIFDADVYRSSSCTCSQSSDGKKRSKKMHSHRKKKEMNFEFQWTPRTSHGITSMENALESFTLHIRRPLVQWQEGTVVKHSDNWGKTEFPQVQIWLSSR